MLRWFVRRLNEARKDERGFTLIELLVVENVSASRTFMRTVDNPDQAMERARPARARRDRLFTESA